MKPTAAPPPPDIPSTPTPPFHGVPPPLPADTGDKLQSATGKMRFGDISNETLDDLESEFETSERGSALSEAMRKQGVSCVKRALVELFRGLQEEVAASATVPKSTTFVTPATQVGCSPPPPPHRRTGAH